MAKKKKKRTNHSTIYQHRQSGKTLIPAMATLPNLHSISWMNDRLPEMLWAALLVTGLSRLKALAIFRRVADFAFQFGDNDSAHDVTLTGFSRLKPETLKAFLQLITSTDEWKEALRPLLLLKKLPARQAWEESLGNAATEPDWRKLMNAVVLTLDHQSQEATDCRWVRLMCLVSGGKFHMHSELLNEIAFYPDKGDMRKVRPSIRAAELGSWGLEESARDWAEKFWTQCLSDTPCLPLPTDTSTIPQIGTTASLVQQVYDLLVQHCCKMRKASSTDPRHETVFGIGLYSLSLLQELLRIGASQSITARISLRTIVEAFISLAYLAKKDSTELWQSYRVFGSGQAKLSYLKLEEMDEEVAYVDVDVLKALANEDVWEEFLPIELGHWEKSNLRRLSDDAGVKEDYDRYYAWTSTYAHAHWGALRDAVYDTCGNPLHRLHRIPRDATRSLPDVLPDACICVDKTLEVVSRCYPEFSSRVAVRIL